MIQQIAENEENLFFRKKIAQVPAVTLSWVLANSSRILSIKIIIKYAVLSETLWTLNVTHAIN